MKNTSYISRIIVIIGITLLSFTFTKSISFAQTAESNECVTKVGQPKEEKEVGCSGVNSTISGELQDVVRYAKQITSSLLPGAMWNFMNNQPNSKICNQQGYCAHTRTGNSTADLYWCSFLVLDSYNLIGKKGLTVDAHLAVVNMMAFWKTTPGYRFFPYDPENPSNPENKNTLQQLRPGMAWFLANNPNVTESNEHTGLIDRITIDTNGNGEIITIESNSDKTSHVMIISGWKVQNTVGGFLLRGFGGV